MILLIAAPQELLNPQVIILPFNLSVSLPENVLPLRRVCSSRLRYFGRKRSGTEDGINQWLPSVSQPVSQSHRLNYYELVSRLGPGKNCQFPRGCHRHHSTLTQLPKGRTEANSFIRIVVSRQRRRGTAATAEEGVINFRAKAYYPPPRCDKY